MASPAHVSDAARTSGEKEISFKEHRKIAAQLNPSTSPIKAKSKKARAQNRIRDNWRTSLEHSLPPQLKPRERRSDGKRADRHQSEKKRIKATEWTEAFTSALAKLSLVTPDQRPYAHNKLFKQVQKRQRQRTHPEQYAREVLTSDIEEVTKQIQTRIQEGTFAPKRKIQNHNKLHKLEEVDFLVQHEMDAYRKPDVVDGDASDKGSSDEAPNDEGSNADGPSGKEPREDQIK